MTNEWRVVRAAPQYEIARDGTVRNIKTKRVRAHHFGGPSKYRSVGLMLSPGRQKTFTVHRLVCLAFHGDPPTPKHEVGHKDGSKDNAHADNLHWVTRAENMLEAKAHGTLNPPRGERHSLAILTDEAVREIRHAKPFLGMGNYFSEKYGITPRSVICLRAPSSQRWPHVPNPPRPKD